MPVYDISYTLTISKRTTTIEARFKKREAPVDEVEIVPGPNPDDPSSTEKGGEVEVIGEAIPGQSNGRDHRDAETGLCF